MNEPDYSRIASRALAGTGPESDGVPEAIGGLDSKTAPTDSGATTTPYASPARDLPECAYCPSCGGEGSLFDAKLELMHCMNATSDGCGKVWGL